VRTFDLRIGLQDGFDIEEFGTKENRGVFGRMNHLQIRCVDSNNIVKPCSRGPTSP
jgi:hypothetical protein